MSDLTAVRATWGFLQTLHPLFLFAESLPTADGAEAHLGGNNHDDLQTASPATSDDVEHLKNVITKLRTGLKLNIIKTQLVDIYELGEDDPAEGLDDLEAELHVVLEELEQIVNPKVLELEIEAPVKPEGPAGLATFPRLVALTARLRESEDVRNDEGCPETQLNAVADLDSMQAISSWSQRYSAASIAHVASLIQYPQDALLIETFSRTVNRFGKALDRVLGDMAAFWKMEAQTLDYTPHDVETIESAHSFATVSTSLFGYMTEGCTRCGLPHQAKLHLSGFKEDSLRFNLSTCEEASWVPAVFICSPQGTSHEQTSFELLCKPVEAHLEQTQLEVQQVMFNSTGMWCLQRDVAREKQQDAQTIAENALDQLLADRDRLTPKYRKLAEVLLAACIFQLNESPWTEQYLRPDYLYVPPLDKKRLHQWCPRLLCDLVPQDIVGQQSDNIAAFGVLVLELEAHRRAAWTSEDEDWLSGAPSNSIRLARVLKDWEDSVSDDYRRVAKACLDFESLIQSLDHPEITSDKKSLAVIYKCILEPLFRHMTTTFEDLTPLFKGMFGPSRGLTAAMEITAEGTAKRALFDDEEGVPKREDQILGTKFMADLKPFFKRIKELYPTSNRMHFPTHEKVRIAVLDSGVNEEDDTMIWQAIKTGRISSKSKSFVGKPGDWMRDMYGHGTHVARLLLETAPAAEIYVAKICTGKAINNESMPGIAAAIKWAVDEVDAHIISISLGFEDEHDEIEAAVDDALDAGKLIIAAASNNGGLSGRARPARQDGVLCMHATDGKGNKGGMNPSPLPKDDNFATLGVAVPSKWDGQNVWKSGTSFAVPIAVGFAAGVLELARYRATGLKPRKLKLLGKKQGMGAVLKSMAEERDGYDFVHPGRLARDWGDEKAVSEAVRTIERVLAKL